MVPHPAPPAAVAAEVAAVLAEVLGGEFAGHVGGAGPGARAVRDDPGAVPLRRGFLQKGHELLGEEEVREVVDLHLDVVSVLGGLVVDGHYPRVAAQDVDALVAARLLQLRDGALHADERAEVAVDVLNLRVELGARLFYGLEGLDGALGRAVEADDPGAPLRERHRRATPGARSRPGDDVGFFPEIGREREAELVPPPRHLLRRLVVPDEGLSVYASHRESPLQRSYVQQRVLNVRGQEL
mmetsp:Transcript_4849/g.19955  ORF Transcript_4849/g.19955 Transcript_4849/m.19955 type:complete len:241 (+) Transcript_4849:1329-2051(+)